MNTKILIIDDHRIFRESLSSLFLNDSITVVGQAGTGEEAIEQIGTLDPNVVLMDISLGEGMDGISTAKIIKKKFPPDKDYRAFNL